MLTITVHLMIHHRRRHLKINTYHTDLALPIYISNSYHIRISQSNIKEYEFHQLPYNNNNSS